MSFAHPLALWALLAVPVVVALHWFRRRLPSRQVAGLFLFLGAEPVPPEGRSLDRLRWSLPLLLECLAAAALALWLAGPVLGDGARPRHLVVALDDSASMAAVGVGGRSAIAAARRSLDARTEALGNETVVTLVFAGERPRVALGPRAPLALLAEALNGVAPAATTADLGAAIALADVLAEGERDEGRGGEEIERVLYTDRPVGVAWPHWNVEAVGLAAPNTALEDVQLVRAGDGGASARLLAAVRSYSERSPVLEVVVDPAGAAASGSLGRRALQLESFAVASLEIELQGVPADAPLEVVLRAQAGDDGLALDDRALVLPEPDRTIAMAWAGTPPGAERARWARLVEALGGVDEGAPEEADLVATDGETSDLVAPVVVRIAPTEGEAASARGPFLRDRSSALLDGVVFEGVVWRSGASRPRGTPLLLDGERVLAAVDDRGDRLVVALNLDLGASSIAARPSWPSLWSNLVEAARARRPGPLRANLRSGEAMLWRLDPRRRAEGRAGEFRMVDPLGGELPQAGLRTLRWEAARPGIHRLLRDGAEVARFAVHFHAPAESDLSTRSAGSRAAAATDAEAPEDGIAALGGAGRGERQVLAWLVLGLLVLDWWVLGRGRRRAPVRGTA